MRATDEEYAFHQRVLAGDPTAFAELAEHVYSELVRRTLALTRRTYGDVDPDLVEEAVGMTLLDYNDQASRFDPERSTLRDYLVMSAYRDAQNLIAKEARRGKRVISLSADTEREAAIEDPIQEQRIEELPDNLAAHELLQEVARALDDPVDLRIAMLMINRVRATEAYAQVLGIAHLPEKQRAQEVKRVKDRIMKRLRRLGEKLDE